jgi:EmrB/QacA subfamily drug resistance transporter
MSQQVCEALVEPRIAPNFRVVALIVAAALFMEQLDATVLATALPTMARDFGVGAPVMSIALTSYLLSLAIFIPASGRIADRFGSRSVFRSAIVIFMTGSILCALSPNLVLLVLARLLQGVGGAMMIPIGRLVIMRSVARKDLVSAMSWFLAPALVGPLVGPPLGGFIVTYFDWRWIFYVNIPIGIVGIILVSLFIEDFKSSARVPFDTVGFVLSGVALGSLLFGFEMSSHPGEGMFSVFLVATGMLSGIAYLRHARKHPAPIMDFSLMKVPSFGTSVIAGSLTRICQGAQPFLLPLLFQIGFGMSAAKAGQVVLATAVGAVAMKAFGGHVFRLIGFRNSMIINGVAGTLIYASCAAFRPDWPTTLIFAILASGACFMSLQFTAYNTVAYDRISQERMSSATSFYTTLQQLMLSLGICVGALALSSSMTIHGNAQPKLGDFSAAFLTVAVISLAATIWNLRFAPTAGAELSGHRRKDSAVEAANDDRQSRSAA